ncbi:hypothetical protein JCM8547_002712 [Rhodosporidiobolus lusitaniae]
MLLRPLLALLTLFSSASAALTASQLRLVFPSATEGDLTGASVELPEFELSVVANVSHAFFVLNATKTAPEYVGWFGIGQGTAMSNADFLVAWPFITPTNSIEWVLSHRTPNTAAPSSHGNPLPVPSSSSFPFTLVPELSSLSPGGAYASVAFLRSLDAGGEEGAPRTLRREETRFIYASSMSNPGSEDGGATLKVHDQPHGTTSLDLSSLVSIPASPDDDDADQPALVSSNSARGRTRRDKVLIAHATLGSLSFTLFTPVAILLARFGRDRFEWFPSHAALNTASGVLVVVTFGLGVKEGGGGFGDFHKRLGLTLFLLTLLQLLLGLLSHSLTLPTHLTSSRPSCSRPYSPLRLTHVLLGLLITALGYVQAGTGLYREWEKGSDGRGEVPEGVKGVFWALLGVTVALYLGAWVVGVKRSLRRKEEEEEGKGEGLRRRASVAHSAGSRTSEGGTTEEMGEKGRGEKKGRMEIA